jgi:arabinogalactan endo-1,4-beta-galactosidase
VKAVSPDSKVILHIDQGNNKERSREWFDNAVKNGAKFDIIGLSYYPYWLEKKRNYTHSIGDLASNMDELASRYGKDVMVVEVGGEANKARNTYHMLKAVIQKVKEVPNHKGLGVFYWEPEGANIWSHYGLSAWKDNGKPTKALKAFSDEGGN